METPKFFESKYIKVSERDTTLNQIELRKKIVHKLKELKRLTSYEQALSPLQYYDSKTNVTVGNGLKNMLGSVSGLQKRDCFDTLQRYLNSSVFGRVFLVLLDPERCKEAERRFGSISKRYVLYCGEDYETKDGVIYLNVENYLKSL